MSLVGKRFKKIVDIEVIAETDRAIMFQNVNNESQSFSMPRDAFEANYVECVNDVEVEDVVMAVTDIKNENNTKEVK